MTGFSLDACVLVMLLTLCQQHFQTTRKKQNQASLEPFEHPIGTFFIPLLHIYVHEAVSVNDFFYVSFLWN